MNIRPVSYESFSKLKYKKYRKSPKEITDLFDEIMSGDSKAYEVFWEKEYKNVRSARGSLYTAAKKRGYRLNFYILDDKLFVIKED